MTSFGRCGRVLLVAVAAAGCGESGVPSQERMQTVPVSGRVAYRGRPLGNVAVIFQSTDGRVSAVGTTDASGAFRLTTYARDDGVPPGSYKVTVASGGAAREIEPGVLAPLPEEGEAGAPTPPVLARYADPTKTDLKADVTEGGTNRFTFELK
jgi:hypothetical protein